MGKTKTKPKITTIINGLELDMSKKGIICFPLSQEENQAYENLFSNKLIDGITSKEFEKEFKAKKRAAKNNPLLNAFRRQTQINSNIPRADDSDYQFYYLKSQQIREFFNELSRKYPVDPNYLSVQRYDKNGVLQDTWWIHSKWYRKDR